MVPEEERRMKASSSACVKLLDGFSLQMNGGAPSVAGDDLPRGVQRLVAHLSLNRRAARASVAGQLWPRVSEAQAQGSLRSALWRLQKSAPGLVVVSGSSLSLATDVQVDVRELVHWAKRAIDPRANVDELQVPDAGMDGELLPGWCDDWVLLERERLRQLWMHGVEVVAERLAAAGRYADALAAAYVVIRLEPLRESAHRVVMRVHLAEGNVGEAIRAYLVFRTMLEADLGVPPSEQMTDLVHGIRRSHGSGHVGRDPGDHRGAFHLTPVDRD
jgi:DNA-binding SARP family transcriptional activator